MRGNADRNASLVIGQRLIARYQKSTQEKPPTPLATERGTKVPGVVVSQDAKSKEGPSLRSAWHGDDNEHGTAQGVWLGMAEHTSDVPRQLRVFNES
jgi:putative transposase